jgi:flagellar hook assembly protein FlgD
MLEQNLPNPFNPLTTIRFVLPTASHATLEIVDVAGRHIRTLVDQSLAKGDHQVVWDGRDNHGNSVASGVYLYRLHSDGLDQSRKMVLLK